MTLPSDYTITPTEGDALHFNKWVTKDAPEERATAQFRKDQFDSTPTVGDQSLTGWWTRGQLSFHKGAGVTYYEVLESETILNRFNTGLGVDPFTPGELSISHVLDELDTSGSGYGFEDCVYVVNYVSGNRIVGRADDGNAYEITTGSPLSSQTVTQITTDGSDPVASIASARFRVYLAVGENIEVWYPGVGDSTVLWTGSLSGFDIVNIWYAKQRLWVVDANGCWYVLDANGGTFATADSVFRIKDYGWLVTTDTTWSLAESPGPVYISAFNEVYAVSVTYDSGSLLPTINAPVLVAEIPNGELIHCLGYALGTLMMGGGQGARFAVSDGNGGLTYGPQLAPSYNFVVSRRVAAVGTRLCTGAYFFEDSGVYSFDLGQLVEDLQPAHVLEMPFGSENGYTGALDTPEGLVSWSTSAQKLFRQSSTTFAESASLKTGYHRFGTLDPKWFRSVLVRVGGDGGSVDVYRVDPDGGAGTETLLGAVTYPDTEADLDLGPDIPAERVALKFVLNRDGTDATKGPILLGYQLKALPMPKRQRLMRVPLLLFDREVDGRTMTKRGQKGQAWTRLAALEALEESNAVVTYADSETGETGLAYIESVEMRRTAAVSSQGDGFGGLLYVTLRKL